ncbi:hypothetical protein TNCV_5062901 [Trichonephila clavipes]|nr:hypothetical protein TNCV_5062901 [Trichonephila clavipes]
MLCPVERPTLCLFPIGSQTGAYLLAIFSGTATDPWYLPDTKFPYPAVYIEAQTIPQLPPCFPVAFRSNKKANGNVFRNLDPWLCDANIPPPRLSHPADVKLMMGF